MALSDVVNEIIRYLQDRQRSRMPTFNRDDPNGSLERLFEYLQEQGDERAPDEHATEDAPQMQAAGASGILGIGGGLSGFQTPNGWLLASDPPPVEKPRLLPLPERFIWGKVASEVGSGVYTFDEQALTDGTTWANKSGGLTGETCYESNDVAGIAVGTIIKIRIEHDTGGTLRYVFDSTVSIEAGTADGDILVWDQTTDKAWEKTIPTEITVVTAFQVTGVTLQVKTRTVKAVAAGSESAWTTVHTGTECP